MFRVKKRVKGTSQDLWKWFDAEIMEKIIQRDQLIRSLKECCLLIDKEKEAKDEV